MPLRRRCELRPTRALREEHALREFVRSDARPRGREARVVRRFDRRARRIELKGRLGNSGVAPQSLRVAQARNSFHAASPNPTSQVFPTRADGARRLPELPSARLNVAGSAGSSSVTLLPLQTRMRFALAKRAASSASPKRFFLASTVSRTVVRVAASRAPARVQPSQPPRW